MTSTIRAGLLPGATLPFLLVLPLAAQEHGDEHAHRHAGPHEHGLHFSHPLVAESVSPDTKLRLDYSLRQPGSASEFELEGEYAFLPTFSIEAGVHFEPDEGTLGDTHLLAKFADRSFAERGILVGYGLSVGLPTGTAHHHHEPAEEGEEHAGEEEVEEEDVYRAGPFVNAGLRRGRWEWAAWLLGDVPLSGADQQESVSYNLSALYHAGGRVQALLELDGARGLETPWAGRPAAAVTAGVKVQPLAAGHLSLGVGLSVPLADRDAYDTHTRLSAFYHF